MSAPVAAATTSTVDVRGLQGALRAAVRGGAWFDPGHRAAYSTDASNYRQVPIGVVIPRDIDDVVAAFEVCRRFGAPVLSRGGGTSLGGQSTNTAVVIDWTKHVNAVESVDESNRTAVVQGGIVLDELNKAARAHGGLVFGPKPATHNHCTIGGMLGNNSCGSTAQWSGTTAANVRRLEVLLYDGTRLWVGPTSDADYEAIQAGGGRIGRLYRELRELRDRYAQAIRDRYPVLPRRISGYNLPTLLPENGFQVAQALVGSESTCVAILRAELDLLPEPRHVALLLAGYDSIAEAADHVPLVNEHQPYVLEGLDHNLVEYERDRRMNVVALHGVPEAGAWLMVKLSGSSDEQAEHAARDLEKALGRAGGMTVSKLITDSAHIEEVDSVREAALGATARVPGYPDTWPGWEDSAVPPERLGGYLRDLKRLLDEYGYGAASLYGHFGDGCVHTSIGFDLVTAKGVADFRSFVTRAAHLCVQYGGSLSGEHGDGQARGELLPIMYGAELVTAFGEFKAIFDPDWKMNPGKVVAPNPLDGQLRLGTSYAPPPQRLTFSLAEDDGSFARATTRCFGVGECRKQEPGGGVMCPSYQVTRDERHSTRGRSRLLFEMLQGEVITNGWRSKEVHEALDLCLACRGCKTDCPVNVDMATYKAEFLAHHYARRLRPRSHYSLGWLPIWARLAAPVPGLANAVTHAPGLRRIASFAAGIDPQRELPRFRRRFTRWFFGRGTPVAAGSGPAAGDRGPVLLWPDTFTNNLDPQIGRSAVEVLEAAGFRVIVPRETVCCGLTWISTGQLGIAKRVLRRSLRILAPHLRAGLPVVGLEPSCTSVLRGDATSLLHGDIDAQRLAGQTVTLAELLQDKAADFRFAGQKAGAGGRAIVQKHCHQHAILGFGAEAELMRRAGLDADVLDSGCCGLAGDFGMVPEHREVSLACAEQVLFPAIRASADDTPIIANGFSCRTQIAETGRRARHLAEVLAERLPGARGTPGPDGARDR